jgi:hypothetical protein
MANPARSLIIDSKAGQTQAVEINGLLALLESNTTSPAAAQLRNDILTVRALIADRLARVEEIASEAAVEAARLSAFHDGTPDRVARQLRYASMSASRFDMQLLPFWAELEHFMQEEARLLREARRLVPGISLASLTAGAAAALDQLEELKQAVARQRILYQGAGLNQASAQQLHDEMSGLHGRGVGLRVLLWRLLGAVKIGRFGFMARHDANNAEHLTQLKAWDGLINDMGNAIQRAENGDNGWTSSAWGKGLPGRIVAPGRGPGPASTVIPITHVATNRVTDRTAGELLRDAIARRGA